MSSNFQPQKPQKPPNTNEPYTGPRTNLEPHYPPMNKKGGSPDQQQPPDIRQEPDQQQPPDIRQERLDAIRRRRAQGTPGPAHVVPRQLFPREPPTPKPTQQGGKTRRRKGRKSKRAKRSYKKTRRAHKKRKSHRKRR